MFVVIPIQNLVKRVANKSSAVISPRWCLRRRLVAVALRKDSLGPFNLEFDDG